jgi:hypothetical protein
MEMAQQKSLKFRIYNSQFFKKVVFILCLVIIFINTASTVWGQKDKYFQFNYWQRFASLEKTFLSSQYVNKHPVGWIADQTAFSYAAGKLITGTSPILVVPDAPPLGKYLIGLSAIIFNNENIIILISSILCLLSLYLLSGQIFSSKILSILPPFFLSFEPIFKNQLIYTPLLDLFQLLFLLFTFYFFNKGFTGKKPDLITFVFFMLANLFLGFFISTKFFITGVTIIAAWFIVLLLNRKVKKSFLMLLSFPMSIIVLLLSYVRVFAFGYTVNKFLGIQKWVYLYHQSFLILPFSVWPLLFLNKWHVWFGDKPVISDSQWLFTWPIITTISLITIVFYLLKKMKREKNIEIVMTWAICYLIFLSFGQTFSRYFVILIPMLYIITIYGIVETVKRLKS